MSMTPQEAERTLIESGDDVLSAAAGFLSGGTPSMSYGSGRMLSSLQEHSGADDSHMASLASGIIAIGAAVATNPEGRDSGGFMLTSSRAGAEEFWGVRFERSGVRTPFSAGQRAAVGALMHLPERELIHVVNRLVQNTECAFILAPGRRMTMAKGLSLLCESFSPLIGQSATASCSMSFLAMSAGTQGGHAVSIHLEHHPAGPSPKPADDAEEEAFPWACPRPRYLH